jgi:hypothetical protein
MVSSGCFFRGDYASVHWGRCLLQGVSQVPALVPNKWGTLEPLTKRFSLDDAAMAFQPESAAQSWIIFLVRTRKPRYIGGMSVSRSDWHNEVFFDFKDELTEVSWLVNYFESAMVPNHADFCYIADAKQPDVDRFREAYQPRPAAELFGLNPPIRPPFFGERTRADEILWYFKPHCHEMRGPHGWLWDVAWYNFFGKAYVELIGKDRLARAGWAHVKEIGGGLACFATERINDANSFEQRARIRAALEEFYWTPACKSVDKRAPIFDFSQQVVGLSKAQLASGDRGILFAGFTKDEERQAVRKIEQETGMRYDQEKKTLKRKRSD